MYAQPSTVDPDAAQRFQQRRIFWTGVLIWLVLSYIIARFISQDMRFRVNDLNGIPGAGVVMRDSDGTLYHVNDENRARAIFPAEAAIAQAATAYRYECLTCSLVTGEELSRTNDFCGTAKPSNEKTIEWQVPCRTSVVIVDSVRVIWFALFLGPLILIPLMLAAGRAMTRGFQARQQRRVARRA